MARFHVGEEVRYEGEIYVIGSREPGDPPRYRLLASRPGGTKFQWVVESELQEIESYLKPLEDTTSL